MSSCSRKKSIYAELWQMLSELEILKPNAHWIWDLWPGFGRLLRECMKTTTTPLFILLQCLLSLSPILFLSSSSSIFLYLSIPLSPHWSPVLINGPTPLHCLSTWSHWGERGREHKRGRCQKSMNNGEGVDCDLSLSVQSAASAMFNCWTLHRPISINLKHKPHTHIP